jgi:hypothetical protein
VTPADRETPPLTPECPSDAPPISSVRSIARRLVSPQRRRCDLALRLSTVSPCHRVKRSE